MTVFQKTVMINLKNVKCFILREDNDINVHHFM